MGDHPHDPGAPPELTRRAVASRAIALPAVAVIVAASLKAERAHAQSGGYSGPPSAALGVRG